MSHFCMHVPVWAGGRGRCVGGWGGGGEIYYGGVLYC